MEHKSGVTQQSLDELLAALRSPKSEEPSPKRPKYSWHKCSSTGWTRTASSYYNGTNPSWAWTIWNDACNRCRKYSAQPSSNTNGATAKYGAADESTATANDAAAEIPTATKSHSSAATRSGSSQLRR